MRILFGALAALCLTACGAPEAEVSSFSDVEQAAFPMGPHHDRTPGELCSSPDSYRYPERIAYCSRDVSSGTKRAIIAQYDRDYGYRIGSMDRGEFKIDHYIPLCMGGSNNVTNLWPQHKSVYVHTDLIEQRACELMAAGRLRQAEAVDMIREVKNDLGSSARVLRDLERRLGRG